jgi:protein-tyrosine-phosphatase
MSDVQLPGHLDAATRRRLERDFADLSNEFTPLLGGDVVDQCLHDTVGRLASGGRSSPFVPLLAQRFAREELVAIAQSTGALAKEVPEVLFVDTHDAARSQIAAALLDQRAKGTVHVRTAGVDPSGAITPVVATVLAARGLDTSRAYAKPLTGIVVRAADVVVTLGCPDAVETDARQLRLDWDVPAPDTDVPAQVSALCDDLDRRIAGLTAHLKPDQPLR